MNHCLFPCGNINERLDYHKILTGWKSIATHVNALEFSAEVKGDGLINSFSRFLPFKMIEAGSASSNKSPDMQLILCIAAMNRLGIACDIGSMLKAAKKGQEKKSFRPMKYLLGRTCVEKFSNASKYPISGLRRILAWCLTIVCPVRRMLIRSSTHPSITLWLLWVCCKPSSGRWMCIGFQDEQQVAVPASFPAEPDMKLCDGIAPPLLPRCRCRRGGG